MSSLRIEIERNGVKAVLDGDTEVVQGILKDPNQLDALIGKLGATGASGSAKPHRASAENPVGKVHSARFEHWKQQHKLDQALHLVLSEVGGEIEVVAPVAVNANSKTQEALGLLIGVKHFASGGEPKIPQKELVNLCKKYGCYDSGNFSTNMKGKRMAIFGSLRDDSWHLTPTGLNEAAELVRSFVK